MVRVTRAERCLRFRIAHVAAAAPIVIKIHSALFQRFEYAPRIRLGKGMLRQRRAVLTGLDARAVTGSHHRVHAQLARKAAHQFKAPAADQTHAHAAALARLKRTAVDLRKALLTVHQRAVQIQRQKPNIHFVHFLIQSGASARKALPA